jgi:hypothetical protein
MSLKRRQTPNFVVFPRRKLCKKMTGQRASPSRHLEETPLALSCSLCVLLGKNLFESDFPLDSRFFFSIMSISLESRQGTRNFGTVLEHTAWINLTGTEGQE